MTFSPGKPEDWITVSPEPEKEKPDPVKAPVEDEQKQKMKQMVEEAMQALQEGLEHDRNLIGFTPEEHHTVLRMLEKKVTLRFSSDFLGLERQHSPPIHFGL